MINWNFWIIRKYLTTREPAHTDRLVDLAWKRARKRGSHPVLQGWGWGPRGRMGEKGRLIFFYPFAVVVVFFFFLLTSMWPKNRHFWTKIPGSPRKPWNTFKNLLPFPWTSIVWNMEMKIPKSLQFFCWQGMSSKRQEKALAYSRFEVKLLRQ